MHATVRNYSGKGSKELIDLLDKRKDEVKGLLTSIKGFVSYSLVRTGESGFLYRSIKTKRAWTKA